MTFIHAVLTYAILPFVLINSALYVLAYTLPPTVLHGHPKRLAAFFARCMAYLGTLTVCAIYGFLASMMLRCVGQAGLGQWTTARAFKYIMYLATGVSFEVEDPEQELRIRPAVFVGNHQTELDVLLLGAVFPPYTSVTSKSSLKWTPILGQFMWASKTVFIDRANSASARQTFNSAANEISGARQSVFIFAEGTRSYSLTPMLLPFKKGAFHLAIKAQVPVIPIACENYAHILVLRGGWKKWKFESGTVKVRVLRRVDTQGLDPAAVDGIAKDVRERMLSTIEEMGKERKAEPIAMKMNGKAQ